MRLRGNLELVKTLIEKGDCINETDDEGKTPLYYASERGHTDVVKLLIDNKVNVKTASPRGYTALHLAIMKEYFEIANLLIKNDADVNAGTENNTTPLHLGATSVNGGTEGIRLLIKNGAIVNVKNADDGETPLFRACIDGFYDRVKLLIEHGADVKIASNDNVSILCWPSARGHTDVVKLLIGSGANVNHADVYGEVPLHRAANNGQTNIIKLLLENGAEINKIDIDGETPLFKAFKYDHIEAAKLLISAALLKNLRKEEKPDFIKTHQDLSAYWDERKVKLELEIVSLKQVTFGRISLFDFYTLGDINKLATMSRNEEIQNIITKTDFMVKYPYFGTKIKENFEKCLARDIIEQIISHLYPIEQQLNWLENIQLVGIEDVDRIILGYLNINDLKSLKEATNNPPINNSSGISFFQRFRTHNDSPENTSISSYTQRP